MAFWTGFLGRIGEAFAGTTTGTTGVVLSKSDGSADLWQSDGAGAANVAVGASALPTGAATEARQTSTTCVSLAAKTAPATPAAAEAISASTACKTGAVVVADDANVGTVYVGGTGVTAATGIALAAGDSFFFSVSDAASVFCVGSVAGQILRVVAL
jgi:hypothetical protein